MRPTSVAFQESPRVTYVSDRSSLASVASSSTSISPRYDSTIFENLWNSLRYEHEREVQGLRLEVQRLHSVARVSSASSQAVQSLDDGIRRAAADEDREIVAAVSIPSPRVRMEEKEDTWQSLNADSEPANPHPPRMSEPTNLQPQCRASSAARMSKQSASHSLQRSHGDSNEADQFTPKGLWKLDDDAGDSAALQGPEFDSRLTVESALSQKASTKPQPKSKQGAQKDGKSVAGQSVFSSSPSSQSLGALSMAVEVNGTDTKSSVDFARGKRPPPKGLRGTARRLVTSPLFDTVFAVLVILDTINNGVEVELRSNYPDDETGLDTVQIARYLMNAMFLIEVVLRITSDGRDFLYSPSWKWNVFDVAIVVLSVFEMLMMLAEQSADEEGGGAQAAGVRAVRIVRAIRSSVRTIRVVRMVRFFTELRQMLAAILGSLRSMFWLAVLLLLILYLFAIIFTGGATEFLKTNEEEELYEQYGTLGRSIWSLYKAMSNGQDWGELVPTLARAGWVYSVLFLLYISFTIFALLNAVTSVFVNNALQATAQEHDLAAEEEDKRKNRNVQLLQRLFQEVDQHGSGTVSMEELMAHLQREEVKTALTVFGIHNNEAESLFKLLDVNDGGEVDINGFVVGCMRLRGEARSIDIAELRKLIIKILARLHDMMIFMEEVSPYAKTRLTERHAAPAIDLRRTMGDTYSSRWTRFRA